MKKITLLFIFLLTTVTAITQPNWRNGKYLTPVDDLHVLVVFVASDDYRMSDRADCNGDQDCIDYYYNGIAPSANPISLPAPEVDVIPDWAQNEGFINELKADINTGLSDDGEIPFLNDNQFNISSYFKTMSFGKFNVTGEVRGIVIPQSVLSYTQFRDLQQYEAIMVDEVFRQFPDLDPAQFDHRQNLPNSNFTDYNATVLENVNANDKDQIIDYVAIIKKVRKFANGKWNETAGYVDCDALSSLPNAFDTNGISHDLGYYHVHDRTKDSKWGQMSLFIHEFAHNMGLAHNCNANGVVNNKFSATKAWGMIATDVKMFWSATAHSMWLNG